MSDSQYIVSARKYRPATFKTVVGQKSLTATLKNAIDSNRLAQAYLFCGPRGVGKTSCARIFAKTINCLSPTPDGEACGLCDSCKAVEEGNSFNIIELDAASNNSVDDIRALTEQVNIPPTLGRYRVFIIDEVHMLSSQAFNAFLKTLEEPPSYVIFILATTEKHKVIPTILSRCQIYDFKRITIQDMVDHLQYVAASEKITADIPALNVIAKKADGAMRDALSIFDQVAASSFGNITYDSAIAALNVLDYEFYFRLVDAFRMGDIPEALMIYKDIRDRGFDSLFFINGLANHIRDLMVAFSSKTISLLEVANDVASQYIDQARSLPVEWLYAAMKILNECDFLYRTSSNKQFLVELTLIKLCQLLNPPTPPFDRVDNDSIPIRTPCIASRDSKPSSSGQSPSPSADATSISAEAPIQYAVTTPNSHNNISTEKSHSSAPPSESATTDSPSRQQPTIKKKTVRGGRRAATTRLSEEEVINVADPNERKRNPVSLDSFLQAWNDYINANPEKHILLTAMRKSEPTQPQPETFSVVVDHPADKQAFELAMPELISFIRQATLNDFITIDVRIDSSKEIIKQIPSHELLADIVSTNRPLAEFLQQSDAELS